MAGSSADCDATGSAASQRQQPAFQTPKRALPAPETAGAACPDVLNSLKADEEFGTSSSLFLRLLQLLQEGEPAPALPVATARAACSAASCAGAGCRLDTCPVCRRLRSGALPPACPRCTEDPTHCLPNNCGEEFIPVCSIGSRFYLNPCRAAACRARVACKGFCPCPDDAGEHGGSIQCTHLLLQLLF